VCLWKGCHRTAQDIGYLMLFIRTHGYMNERGFGVVYVKTVDVEKASIISLRSLAC
jgi:hypothetical protein